MIDICIFFWLRTFPIDEVYKHGPEQTVLAAATPLDQEVQHVWIQGNIVLETKVAEGTLWDNTGSCLCNRMG